MSGTFSSINTALSAIRYNQVALDLASNNIANANTDGYVRRRLVAGSVGGPTTPAMWSKYDGHGDGVRVVASQRMVDVLLDGRVRREHGTLSYLQTTQTVLKRLDDAIAEPSDNGVAAALQEFRSSWHDLANNPGGDAARQQVLGRAATLVQAIHSQLSNVTGEEADQRVHMLSLVSDVSSAAGDLAALNQTILSSKANGNDVADLEDQRDQLALRLSELAGAVTTVRPDGMYDVTVGGQSLVSGNTASSLTIASGITATGDSDGTPLTLAVTGPSGTTPVTGLGGEVGAVSDLLTTVLPGYRAGLDAVAKDLADTVNAQHAAGYDASGAAGGDFFSYDPADPAASLAVAITDTSKIAAASVAGTVDGNNADALSQTGNVESAYQRLVNSFGVEVSTLNSRTTNQQALAGSVDESREQQAGVNLDEETVNLMTAQRAYQAAARVMSTIDEVLDTLINRTGLVGR
ncbi:flagellar hook-associated protein FlgK [Nocardioides panacisoli]|uniref:Flagellar hook-associated protein 1 n=1 Tax=Nocardioides panacisoli TaxID=627624 RepID=A0ABP7HQJ4_9ACTN